MKKAKILAAMAGAGLAAAAGFLFLSDTREAKKRRRQVRSWMLRFKADVMDKLEDMKDASAEAYEKAIDDIKEKYENMKDMDKGELEDLAHELKDHWENIREEAAAAGSATVKAGKKILSSRSARREQE